MTKNKHIHCTLLLIWSIIQWLDIITTNLHNFFCVRLLNYSCVIGLFIMKISKVVCFLFICNWINIIVISKNNCFTCVWNSAKYIVKFLSINQSVLSILYDVIFSIWMIYIDLYLIKACVKRNKFYSQMFAWKMVKYNRRNENGFVFRCHWLSSFLDVCVWSINLQIFQFLSSYGWWRILKFMQ